MTVQEFYESIGGNYADACSRLMNDAFIMRFVGKFLEDESFAALQAAMAAGNYDDAFRQAHTLKGVALNLAFAKLGASANALTDALRPENEAQRASADLDGMLAEVKVDYEAVCAGIKELQA